MLLFMFMLFVFCPRAKPEEEEVEDNKKVRRGGKKEAR